MTGAHPRCTATNASSPEHGAAFLAEKYAGAMAFARVVVGSQHG